MNATVDRRVESYLKRLRRALRDVPRQRRQEILEEIEGHIVDARAASEVPATPSYGSY